MSFSEEVTEFDDRKHKNSKYFNVEELLKKGNKGKRSAPKSPKKTGKRSQKIVVTPDILNDTSDDNNAEESQEMDSNEKTSINNDEPKENSESFRTTVYFQNSSDEEQPKKDGDKENSDSKTTTNFLESSDEDEPAPQVETTDADFDKLFSDDNSNSNKSPNKDTVVSDTSKEDTSAATDLLTKAVEEAGIMNQPTDESQEGGSNSTSEILPGNESHHNHGESDPLDTSPFKLLFSTFGGYGAGSAQANTNTESENLSTTLDPDEFLQKHFK